jgi:arginyl-tRNA synthetase
VKQQLEELLHCALAAIGDASVDAAVKGAVVSVERTRDAQHGDFSSNIALKIAKSVRRNPRELAQAIVVALPASALVARTEIAGAGFINFHLASDAYHAELRAILEQAGAYGRSEKAHGTSVMIEFVSANPTGPLHVGHGRHAAYGASLANLLAAVGHRVYCEYYINDAGRQMQIFTLSVWLRYLELGGEKFAFPGSGYRGDYIVPIAAELLASIGDRLQRTRSELLVDLPPDAPEGDADAYIDAVIARARNLLGETGFREINDFALGKMLALIRSDLAEFGVTFDNWFSERALNEAGDVERTLATLKASGNLELRDGAWWFRSTAFGDEKDRVVVRENGQKTYFASDIAYHLNKRERGFDHLINVWGADHHGYIARVRASLEAAGAAHDYLEVRLIQLVALFKGGAQLSMGKRSGEFVTLQELRHEVGNDATRFFYVMRSNEQHLDFDLELAKSRSNDNPVYYIQYAHARVASVLRQAHERGFAFDAHLARAHLSLLCDEYELALMRSLSSYPEVIELAAAQRAPHMLVQYLRELANAFHTYYNAQQFIVPDAKLRNARLALVLAVQQVVRNGLALLGVAAPDSM